MSDDDALDDALAHPPRGHDGHLPVRRGRHWVTAIVLALAVLAVFEPALWPVAVGVALAWRRWRHILR